MDSLCFRTGIYGIGAAISACRNRDVRQNPAQFSGAGRPTPANGGITVENDAVRIRHPFGSPIPANKHGTGTNGASRNDAVPVECDRDNVDENGVGNWVFKILHVSSLWSGQKGEDDEEKTKEGGTDASSSSPCSSCEACGCVNGGESDYAFDRNSFSKLLKKVSLADAELYAQLSYLGNLAYAIPTIKPGNRLRRQGVRYVTSSIEKREHEKQTLAEGEEQASGPSKLLAAEDSNGGPRIIPSAAFQIASSAASYLNTQTRNMFSSSTEEVDRDLLEDRHKDKDNSGTNTEADMASVKATTESVTAVVASKEEAKQAVADDLNSIGSSPCEWYICDDDQSATRFFVIQGSESLASWQANLLFEPVEFEGLGVYVHRGIYEAAKGIYEQMLPEINEHLEAHGESAKLRFTGHSLGGSLSLLINLMLLIRGDVPRSSLLPVITFGSPSIICGGDRLLDKLGLDRSHVQGIAMHRDIVPRAFSSTCPSHVVDLLKAVNGNFRNHPCLNNQKILYAPMGEMIILQPDENFSPEHDLLPSGSGLYVLACPSSDEKQLRAARSVFLNYPHPLEILSDRSAYGNRGTVQRDHDMNSYLKCIRSLIRHELNRIRKSERERRRKAWWPLVLPRVVSGSRLAVGGPAANSARRGNRLDFSGIVRTGNESLKRFSGLVASRHMHLLVVLLFPARLLVGVYGSRGGSS